MRVYTSHAYCVYMGMLELLFRVVLSIISGLELDIPLGKLHRTFSLHVFNGACRLGERGGGLCFYLS